MLRPFDVGVPVGLLVFGLAACAPTEEAPPGATRSPVVTARPSLAAKELRPSVAPDAAPPPEPRQASTPEPTRLDPEPRMLRATMRIPALGVRALPVVPYRGRPDDGRGTRIQNGGVAASPFGRRGGVGPGQVGNYLVTGHRTTSPPPFAELPSLRPGDHVRVRARGRVFDYRVARTRWTSFRSPRSRARQVADVPGHPGVQATRAMITLSTCATPEDHARGNYWSDRFHNPEHRIDKIGVLVGVRPADVGQANAQE